MLLAVPLSFGMAWLLKRLNGLDAPGFMIAVWMVIATWGIAMHLPGKK